MDNSETFGLLFFPECFPQKIIFSNFEIRIKKEENKINRW